METKRKYNILIVEDSLFYATFLSKQIDNYLKYLSRRKNFNYQLHVFENEDELNQHMNTAYDIAFIDYHLGNNTTANRLIERLKRKYSDIKIMVMSATLEPYAETYTTEAGANQFVRKGDQFNLMKTATFLELALLE